MARSRYNAQSRDDIANALLSPEFWKGGSRVWPVWHRTCRDIAFFYSQPLDAGVELESSKSFDYNGNHPEPLSPMICGACHETIKKIDLCAQRPGELLALPGENPILKVLKL